MRRSMMAATAATVLIGLACAGAASAQTVTRIQVGQTARGELTASDPRMGDNSAYDCFSINTVSGRTYTVTQRSSAFDAYMAVTPSNDCRAMPRDGESNDDGPNMGTDAQLVFRGTGQPWIIRANSLSADMYGAYTIQVVEGGSAPGVAQSKPPANSTSTSTAASGDQSTRDIYEFAEVCMAADIVESQQGVADTPAREAETMKIFTLMMNAGASLGISEDQMTESVGGLVAAWMDPEMLRQNPPGQHRRNCLDVIDAALAG